MAELFPMMTDDELTNLAEDIKENGLLHPIVLDGDGVLIDGRNRLRACEIAGVEPTYQSLNGHDAAAFIVSANLARRNLSKGQQAMALAMIYPEPGRGGRGNTGGAKAARNIGGFSDERLRQARSILRHSHALAGDVLAARTTFDIALAQVDRERRDSMSVDAKLAQLRAAAPDVAVLVDDEILTLEAGLAELGARQRRSVEAIDGARRAIEQINDLPVQLAILQHGLQLRTDLSSELNAADIIDAVQSLIAILQTEATP
jgi:hypothetical protein